MDDLPNKTHTVRKVKLPNMIPCITKAQWAKTFSEYGHQKYFERKRDEVIKAIHDAGVEVEI